MSKDMQSKSEVKNRPAAGAVFREGASRFSFAYFLAALSLLFVTSPFIDELQSGIIIESILLTLVLFSAVLAIGGRRSTLFWAAALAAPALAAKWFNHLRPDLLPPEVFLGAGMLFITFVALHIFGFILRTPRVTSEVLYAGISNYLMLGLLWSFAYLLIARVNPDAFFFTVGPVASRAMTGFNSYYFSFATLTTLGYGDIIPVSRVARMMAASEAVTGLFYVTMIIARLVALYSSERPAM